MVLWFIGLSGAGKTMLSQLLYEKLKPSIPNLVRLDGDVLRALFGNDVDHTIEGRQKNAVRLSHLSKFLADQNIHVIAAVLSIFPEWQQWNRENIKNYSEIYLKVSLEVLKQRDTKGLYASAFAGKTKNVVGVDIDFPEPQNADMVLENNIARESFDSLIEDIMNLPDIQSVLSIKDLH